MHWRRLAISSWVVRTWQWLSTINPWWKRSQQIPGPWFNIKMSSYQYRKSHCGDKTAVRSSYVHNWIFYTDKMSSLYWIRALGGISQPHLLKLKEWSTRFHFNIIHIPGVRNFTADAVSRHPVGYPVPLHLPFDPAPLCDIFSSMHTREQDIAEVYHQYSKSMQVIQSITWDDVRLAIFTTMSCSSWSTTS